MDSIQLSPSQAVQLLGVAQLIKDRRLIIYATHLEEESKAAVQVITDIAQEIALQIGAKP